MDDVFHGQLSRGTAAPCRGILRGMEPRTNWSAFDADWAPRVAAADATWAGNLSPEARLAIVDDLFGTIREARIAAGDWHRVDERAWSLALAERLSTVRAFRTLDEARRAAAAPRDVG